MSKERELLKKALKYVGLSSNDVAKDLYDEIYQLLTQPEQEPLTPRQGLAEYKRGYAQAKLDLKREPFGPEERERLSRAYITKAEQEAFKEGIILAEILYSIGGGK